MHADRAVLTQHDPAAVKRLHRSQVVELNSAVVLRFDDWLLERLTGRAADVECPHRQLCSRFADGLRGDNSNRFSHFHELAGGEVASIAHSADAATCLASEHRADLQTLHTDALQLVRDLLIDELVRFHDFLLLFHRVRDRFAADTADDALGKIDNFLVALVNRANNDAVNSAAIFDVDNHVLCGVYQFTGQITGVRRFQRGIGQTFARAVS